MVIFFIQKFVKWKKNWQSLDPSKTLRGETFSCHSLPCDNYNQEVVLKAKIWPQRFNFEVKGTS